jgi:lysophospholipase L1-like esterase
MQTFVPPPPIKLNTSDRVQPLKVVALGDSLVYGYGDPEGGGWVEQLRRRWMQPDSPGHVLYNLGVRGDRVQQVDCRLEAEFRHRGELRNRVPDLILLSVGVNDSARLGRPDGRNYTDFEAFEADVAALLDRSQRLCPVFFIGMTPIDPNKMPFMNAFHYTHADQYRYKEAIRLACAQRQIPYLDLFDSWMARGESWVYRRLSDDGLHPNSLGYQTILEEVLTWYAMMPYLHSWRLEIAPTGT